MLFFCFRIGTTTECKKLRPGWRSMGSGWDTGVVLLRGAGVGAFRDVLVDLRREVDFWGVLETEDATAGVAGGSAGTSVGVWAIVGARGIVGPRAIVDATNTVDAWTIVGVRASIDARASAMSAVVARGNTVDGASCGIYVELKL